MATGELSRSQELKKTVAIEEKCVLTKSFTVLV